MEDRPIDTATARPKTDQRDVARARAAGLLKLPPEQIEDDLIDFLVETDRDALLRARAGSGKTTALGIKVAYLTQDCGVDPTSIMLLAFNNAAARSIEQRLKEFGVPDGVRVRTFHALAQRIVRAHFGNWRRAVFDEASPDGVMIKNLMEEALDEVVNDKFYGFCASRMRTNLRKRRDYVEGVGRDALASAANFLRARGYGMQNRYENAWEEGGPIAGNAMKVVMRYEGKLKEAGLLDGPSVLQAASWTLEKEIEQSKTRESDAHGVQRIFIDEFQDVSLPYMRLVSAIRDINGAVVVQGVGDDWQAINGFAGADLDYFSNVSEHLDNPVVLNLLRNRRSGATIVDWGNSVMRLAGYGDAPAVPFEGNGEGEVSPLRASASRDLRLFVSKLANAISPEAKSVALIARKWKVGDHGLRRVTKMTQDLVTNDGLEIKVTGITAHGSKGLEYDQVLLIDDGSFPMEHPSRPILEDLIDEAAYLREESCLLHVAGTRAKRILTVVDAR